MEWPIKALVDGRVTRIRFFSSVCMTSFFILFFVLRGFGDDKGHVAQPSHGGKGQIEKEPQQCATRPRNIAFHLVH